MKVRFGRLALVVMAGLLLQRGTLAESGEATGEASVAGTEVRLAGERPNIIYFLVDDMGFSDCGFNGAKDTKTPNIDALAARGTTFANFYVQPLCSPTRAALLTGRFPVHTGMYTALKTTTKYGLPLNETTLAQGLKTAGYETAIVGKWHVGEFEPAYRPTARGFDHQYGLWYGQLDYFTHVRGGRVDWYRDDKPLDEKGYTTELIGKEAVRLIQAQAKDKPLFLYVPFNAVHAPFQVAEEYREGFKGLPKQRQTLAAMMAVVDQEVGRVMGAVKEKGWEENTLVIFSSDNGGVLPGRFTSNAPLRAGKGTMYEGGVRSSAFVMWPGKVKAGGRGESPVHVVDWYPTLMKLAGATEGAKQLPVDGVDIWPAVTEGKAVERDALLLGGTAPGRAAIRMGDWKLILNPNRGHAEGRDPEDERGGEEKEEKMTGRVELYNLAADIGEKDDVSAKEPARVKAMRARLEALMKGEVKVGGGGPAGK